MSEKLVPFLMKQPHITFATGTMGQPLGGFNVLTGHEIVYSWSLIASGVSAMGALLGAIPPVWKAVKQDVIQALAYEIDCHFQRIIFACTDLGGDSEMARSEGSHGIKPRVNSFAPRDAQLPGNKNDTILTAR